MQGEVGEWVVPRLHSLAVGSAGDAPLPPAVAEPLAGLVCEEDGAGDGDEADEVEGPEGLGLEDVLEPGEVDDEELAGDGEAFPACTPPLSQP